MFSTKSVNSLRKLFAGYHEPLSLSKQQSQKLLDGLKTSFRNQLDREYGHSTENAAMPTTKVGDADHRIRHSAANVHLKSILSNPLFSYNKEPALPLTSALSLPKRDPMDVFDHAVSKGMMTLKAATGCLVAKHQQISPNDAYTPTGSLDIALRMVRWLRSSGEESDLKFLDNQAFVRALAPFLVAENMEGVAWEWIVRAMNDPTSVVNEEQRVRRASFLLSQLVRIKSQAQYGNLDAAIQTILEAEQLFQQSPMLPKLLVQPWRSVSWLSTVESYSRAAPSEKLFDAHMATADRLPRPFVVERAHLHLYHPTHPNHIPALRFFSDREKLRKLAHALGPEKLDLTKLKGMGVIPWIAFLGHDTINHLKQSGRSQEAQGVTELLRSELSDIFGETLSPT
ncbi:hypothetical protein PT974_09024 [Cladobotryum mycophilum]|uniref:Uncharacterized protein n=1 Tax=Cladobotryum mycophilum TaxID=491253 RepID=A0ABR0SFL7_9HYPO